MTPWRYIAGPPNRAAEGLATDEVLMRSAGTTLRLYSYAPLCALVGRYQSVPDEVDVEFCRENGIEISRRPTGGGAIVMGPDQLAVAVTTGVRDNPPARELLGRFAAGLIAGLDRLGIDAALRGKNDLEVRGKKIAGLGLYRDGDGGLLFHSSLLLDLDVEGMLRILRIPGRARHVERRLTTLSRELGRPVVLEGVRDVFVDGFRRTFGVDMVAGTLDDEEHRRAAVLVRERYADPAWVLQESARPEGRAVTVVETPSGRLGIHLGVHGRVIKNALFTANLNELPPSVVSLEAELRWCRVELPALEALVERLGADDDLGLPRGTLARAVWRTATTRGAPVRLAGSCYAPDTLRVSREDRP